MKIKPSDNRATPEWLMGVFEGWFDPCPLNPNPEIDGLTTDWGGERIFINPPYSNPAPWVYRAIEEAKKGKTIVLLMRFDPSTRYFKALIENNAHFFYCGERLRFVNPESPSNYASPFPSVLIVLNEGALNAESQCK